MSLPPIISELIERFERNREAYRSGQYRATKTGHDKTTLQRQIAATDRQIDRLVYRLYNLSEEEIKIVEGAS